MKTDTLEVPELLIRLDAAREIGHLPPRLADDLAQVLCSRANLAEKRQIHRAALQQAARFQPGTPWKRAIALAEMIRRWSGRRQGVQPVQMCLVRAADTGLKLPKTPRGLFNILDATEN